MHFIRQSIDHVIKRNDTEQVEFGHVPLGNQDMVALFDYLEDLLDCEECEHSFDLTGAFLTAHNIAPDRVVPWLQQRGVKCDCDVLGEFEFAWRNAG